MSGAPKHWPTSTSRLNRGRLRKALRYASYGLAGLAGVLLLIAAIAAAVEATLASRDRVRFPAPGRMVDVGTHEMHLYCTGDAVDGRPTVVLEAGLQLWSSGWHWVQRDVSRATRVCSYDRTGLGWSQSRPEAFDGESISRQLHTLLDAANVSPPYVLVGHSLGGMTVRIYYELYPGEVAGMVLVDPGLPTEYIEEEEKDPVPCNWQCAAAALGGRLAIFRFQNRTIMSHEEYPSSVVPEIRAHLGTPTATFTTVGYLKNISPTGYQTLGNESLRNLPLTILNSTDYGIEQAETAELRQRRIDRRERILSGFRNLAGLSSRGRGPIAVEGSNHESIIMYERHAHHVVTAILDVVAETANTSSDDRNVAGSEMELRPKR